MSDPTPTPPAAAGVAAILPHVERLGPSALIVGLVLQLVSTVGSLEDRLEAMQAQLQAAAVAAAVIPHRIDDLARRVEVLEAHAAPPRSTP